MEVAEERSGLICHGFCKLGLCAGLEFGIVVEWEKACLHWSYVQGEFKKMIHS